MMLIHWKFCN